MTSSFVFLAWLSRRKRPETGSATPKSWETVGSDLGPAVVRDTRRLICRRSNAGATMAVVQKMKHLVRRGNCELHRMDHPTASG
ncbi:hypothetical protein DFJ66_4774 [Saccharothrix variisporea]|uniref:Uncharacterized protein n=1 Tax=Saccharothrix variisporea TaxID=543527 RepID=A0A495XF94_9PSEU|nr:hypothetical protein DFJ66_4774 [Saccharothrix variisporea]